MEYEAVIGLETHVQLKTQSKMWCGCLNQYGAEPNTNVCPVCLGMPGVLPVANEEALRLTVLTGYLLNCEIPHRAKFDRKNYFYPDAPKNYQLTQYDQPSTINGFVDFEFSGGISRVRITRAHLEEDVGKRRSIAIRKAIVRTAPATNTSPLPRTRKPDLVLLADAVVPDPGLVARLFRDGVAQLVVWAGEGVGMVGPLVVPGRSPCLHCVDLHKTTSEPAWPALATQLAGRPQLADLASAQASAAFAVSQALRVLDGPHRGGEPLPVDPTDLPVWGAEIEIDTYTSETNRTAWPKHPFCTCSAAVRGSESKEGGN